MKFANYLSINLRLIKITNMGKTKYLGQIGSAVLTFTGKKNPARRKILFLNFLFIQNNSTKICKQNKKTKIIPLKKNSFN